MIVRIPRSVVNVLGVLKTKRHRLLPWILPEVPLERPSLDRLAASDYPLPAFVRNCPVAMEYLSLLGDLPWHAFPERPLNPPQPGPRPAPRAPYAAAFLVKIDRKLRFMSDLRRFLAEHPALVWVLGFPLVEDSNSPLGFDVEASLPSRKHLGYVLRQMPKEQLDWLLDAAVGALDRNTPGELLANVVSLDTKHILAWVKENNPKAYVSHRFDPKRQPTGDPDCRLGCKRRSNTPPVEATPASEAGSPEFYWGYASGVVASRLSDGTEIVLAELTQTFDRHDVTYFEPLMAATERRLGRRPSFGALDVAFDAFYVYDYFNQAGGFAAVPFVARGGVATREFDQAGNPICQAGLSMQLQRRFMNRTSFVEHERGIWICPLLGQADACPVDHAKWPDGGCQITMGTSSGARLRYQLDRKSPEYKAVYKQRTATERINSQATALGIERPGLRNGAAIANHNTLLYVLIDLRALRRIRQRPATRTMAA
jgi:hypothetical protein